MKRLKMIYKFLCICILLGVTLCFKNSGITNETRSLNTNLNKNVNLNAMAKVVENFALNDKFSVLDTYSGNLTGYAADCPLCSGRLGCTGQNVLDGTTTYFDSVYGTVNIVASSSNLPCGSVVKFISPYDPNTLITAIVLDRGVTGTNLDLLVDSEQNAITYVGNRRINYDILRFGWTKAEA